MLTPLLQPPPYQGGTTDAFSTEPSAPLPRRGLANHQKGEHNDFLDVQYSLNFILFMAIYHHAAPWLWPVDSFNFRTNVAGLLKTEYMNIVV